MQTLLDYIISIAEIENTDPKIIAPYAMQSFLKKTYDFERSKMCQRIIDTGAASKVNKMPIDKCSYHLDSLEIGERKYIKLRRVFASEDVKIPGVKKLAAYRQKINLVQDIFPVSCLSNQPVGVGISYAKIVTHTVKSCLTKYQIWNLQIFLLKSICAMALAHRSYKRSQCPRLSQKQKIHRIKFCKDRISWSSEYGQVLFSPTKLLSICVNHLIDRSIELELRWQNYLACPHHQVSPAFDGLGCYVCTWCLRIALYSTEMLS